MKRRDFSKTLLAAGLAAPPVLGPTSALATISNDDDDAFERFVRMQLVLSTGLVTITWLLLLYPVLLGLNFQRTVPRFLLWRAALGTLLLGLQHAPFSRRFRGSLLLGNVVLMSNMLLVLPLLARPPQPNRTFVANDAYEYAHPGKPKPVKFAGLPARSQLDKQPVIGTARVNDKGEVGLVIPPLSMKLQF